MADLQVWLVFITKVETTGIDPQMFTAVEGGMDGVASDFGARLLVFQGFDDGCVLQVDLPLTVPVAALVNSLKGVSSRFLGRLQQDTWQGWSPSYYAGSEIGARRYLEQMRRA